MTILKATVNGDAGTFSPPDFRFLNVNFTRASTDQPPNAVASEAEPAHVVMEPEDAAAAAEAATTSELAAAAAAVSEPSVAAAAALSPLPEINEGDTFFALATFVSETGEAMNLVEGEKVQWDSTLATSTMCHFIILST